MLGCALRFPAVLFCLRLPLGSGINQVELVPSHQQLAAKNEGCIYNNPIANRKFLYVTSWYQQSQ